MNHFVAFDPAINTASSPRGSRSFSSRFGLSLLLGVCCAGSFVFGAFAGLGHSAQHSYSKGACLALEFAENFGAVGATQKRQALRALTTSGSRNQNLFPKSVEEFEELCVRTWTTDVRFGR